MATRPCTIAIDGPAASGKSTVSYLVAERLGFLYVDTGAMYRAVTLLALRQNLDLSNGDALGDLAEQTTIRIEPPDEQVSDGRHYTVQVDDEDITWEIRHHLVDKTVSQVAAHPRVRKALRVQQRKIGLRGNVVMVGRDIGTVVLPEAPLKIYLDASIEERTRRRYRELERRGEKADYEALLSAMRRRDHLDSSRHDSPLRPAEDAHHMNSEGLPVSEVVEEIITLWDRVMMEKRQQENTVTHRS